MMAILSPLLLQLAQEFRQACQYDFLFPYDIEQAILHAFPLSVVKLSKPGVGDIQEWLTARGISIPGMIGADRQLFGCTILYRGRGFIFVDGTAAESEVRFTLAHELAHYLREYNYPRKMAVEKMGLKFLEVLDDERPPQDTERVNAILVGAPLSVYIHLMERGADGGMIEATTNQAEADADYLALELIAPYEAVLRAVDVQPNTVDRDVLAEHLHGVLVQTFDLPSEMASQYARRLARSFGRRPSVRAWLGL
jgi:hypothetical protein